MRIQNGLIIYFTVTIIFGSLIFLPYLENEEGGMDYNIIQ
jgi:hypothetical protein